MRIIEEIILKVGVDVTGLDDVRHAEDDLNGLERSTEDYSDSADKSTTATNSMGGAITGMAIAAAAATAALGIMIAKNIEAQTETLFMAEALGIGAQRLQDLQNLARSFGATAEDMVQGIKNINESISEAFVDQSGAKFDLFKELNIDLKEFQNLDADDQFIQFSKALNKVESQGRRTAIKLALMGEEGFKLSLVMKELGENSEKTLRDISGKGGDIDSEQILRFSQAWTDLKISIEGVTDGIADGLIPVLQGPLDFIEKRFDFIADSFSKIDLKQIAKDGVSAQQAFLRELERTGAGKIVGGEGVFKGDASFKFFTPEDRENEDKAERRRLEKILDVQKRARDQGKALRDFARKQEIDAEKKKNQKIESERIKQEERDKRLEDRNKQRRDREEKSAIRTLDNISRTRKRDRLSELKERQITGDLTGVEAGSEEAARLAAERAGFNPAERAEIAKLELELQQEENEKIESIRQTALDQLTELKKFNEGGTTKVITKRIK